MDHPLPFTMHLGMDHPHVRTALSLSGICTLPTAGVIV